MLLVAIARAAQRVAARDGGAFRAGDVLLDVARELVGAAAQAGELALDQLRVLEGRAVDFLRGALGRSLRKAQELHQVASGGEGAAGRLRIHGAERSAAG